MDENGEALRKLQFDRKRAIELHIESDRVRNGQAISSALNNFVLVGSQISFVLEFGPHLDEVNATSWTFQAKTRASKRVFTRCISYFGGLFALLL